jgi:Zn-dependent proteases
MDFILYLPILFFSVILHEFAHGYTAYMYGDDTAYLMGRLTFNPLAHIDLIGTIILPAICYFMHIPMFGWARPVPVNFYRLRNPKKDMAKVALAGPLSNIFLVLISAIALKAFIAAGVNSDVIAKIFIYSVMINLLLAIFNLIPIPPLDGSRIVAGIFPYQAAQKYMRLERYGMYIVIIFILTGLFNLIVVPVFNLAIKLVFSFIGVNYGQF